MHLYVVISVHIGLLFISVAVAKKLWLLKGFAGFLPVVSWVLQCKWLIINGIHFAYCVGGMRAIASLLVCILFDGRCVDGIMVFEGFGVVWKNISSDVFGMCFYDLPVCCRLFRVILGID